jgi:hypothetical protein
VKFDQLTKKNKNNFNQTPKLTENFDQLKMSSEIRSISDATLKGEEEREIETRF